jgi:hypothetical protein
MQLCHGYDEVNFPFLIATDYDMAKVFLLNINTQKRVPLIQLKQIYKYDGIWDIQQTSKFESTQDGSEAKHYSKLKEIILHFKYNQHNKDGGDKQLFYCQLKLSTQAIKLLIKTQGDFPNTYLHALNDNLRLTIENEQLQKITKDYSQVKKLIVENE